MLSAPQRPPLATTVPLSSTPRGPLGSPKAHCTPMLACLLSSLSRAWRMSSTDRLLHTLPLHHIHGIVNALLCTLYSGGTVEFAPKFSASGWWARLSADPPVTVFMGVPTMYDYLIKAYEKGGGDVARAKELRLMVSGSAACPKTIMERWKELTGQTLLERYGMTEIGMALSNVYHPIEQRCPGAVGFPLPGVEVRVVPLSDDADSGATGVDQAEEGDEVGELRVRGPSVFAEYIGREEATKAAFDEEGYFKTGDTVSRNRHGLYRILGRTSVDIIKSGGYKISALEIESELLNHPAIPECAVIGIPDPALGEVVGVVLGRSAEGGQPPTQPELAAWCKDRLPPYKIPQLAVVLDALPRNAMGKVAKKTLVPLFTEK
eukprot:Sspe_Gene.88152::Locus_60239_Transcript_1_2_Confidence_0.500_Length_1647::g.88152::m.88152/K18660/ACSF3; malonyl-CoA/methylmalonyl-CoA synthetase